MRITCPICGERDRRYTALAATMAGRIGRGRIGVVPGAGHNLVLEAPETVARSVDAEFSAARDIGRDSGDLPPALRQAAFDAPFEGGTRVGGVSLADGSYGAWILSNVIPGDPGALTAEEREQIRQQLAQASAGADLNGYVGELRQSATVVINREQFE